MKNFISITLISLFISCLLFAELPERNREIKKDEISLEISVDGVVEWKKVKTPKNGDTLHIIVQDNKVIDIQQ